MVSVDSDLYRAHPDLGADAARPRDPAHAAATSWCWIWPVRKLWSIWRVA